MIEQFPNALKDKKLPILTLDRKWYRLLDEETNEAFASLQGQLNEVLKRQGKLNSESNKVKKLKRKLMGEIVALAGEAEQGEGRDVTKEMEQRKKLLEECNQRLLEYRDELLDLPGEIERLNASLMLATMEHCYIAMKENDREMEEIARWVTQVRIELKKRLVKKQALERKNHDMYSYMHDVFGPEVMELFDRKFEPEEQTLSQTGEKSKKQE